MKNKILKYVIKLKLLFFLLFPLSSTTLSADGPWYSSISVDVTHGTYSSAAGSNNTNNLNKSTATSILYDISYLERYGFTLKATQSTFSYNDKTPNFLQNKFSFLFHQKSSFDSIKGSINSSLSTFSVTEADTAPTFAIYPEFYYLNYSQTILLGGGYAYSTYGGQGNNGEKINQYTASLGFVPYFKNIWLASKNYYIENQNQTYTAYSIKLNVKVNQSSRLLPKNYLIGILTGTRQYAIEQDTLLIYNTEDIQSDSYFVSARWNMVDNGYLAITAGTEQYESPSNNQKYNYNFINASIFFTW